MLDYRDKLILAPMVKIGTLPTRLLAIKYGAHLVYTEEIIDFRIIRCQRIENKVLNTIDYVDKTDATLVLRISPKERGKLVLQIGTSDAKRAVIVAKMVEQDVDAIDVNMGCPKSFSMKGGMGAALLTQPQKIKDILTSLVNAVNIPITCKIRIKSNLQDTLDLVKVIESTGVSALGVHGRTKDERPNHDNHVDVIQEVVKNCKLPVIANGGSSNNRNSVQNTYQGIIDFWKESGAASVMVARAAEWNISVFRPEGKVPIMELVSEYLDLAIEFDYPFIIAKYNMQQILGSEQESELGKKFLASSTMRDLCVLFGKEEIWLKRQEYIRNEMQNNPQPTTATTFRFQKDSKIRPKKRKLSEIFSDDPKISKSDLSVTSMFCPFVRGHYANTGDIPKVKLYQWALDNAVDAPEYQTQRTDKTFRSVVTIKGQRFSSDSWEKNKKYSEQAAAIVALHCLGIHRLKGVEDDEQTE